MFLFFLLEAEEQEDVLQPEDFLWVRVFVGLVVVHWDNHTVWSFG